MISVLSRPRVPKGRKPVQLGAFGKRLRQLAPTDRFTTVALADKLGVSRPTLYDWLKSDSPTDVAIESVLEAFPGTAREWLTGEADPPAAPNHIGGAASPEGAAAVGTAVGRPGPLLGKSIAGSLGLTAGAAVTPGMKTVGRTIVTEMHDEAGLVFAIEVVVHARHDARQLGMPTSVVDAESADG